MAVADRKVARLNVMRLNAARLDVYNPVGLSTINGVDVSSKLRIEGATITQQLNQQPDTAAFRVSGMTPVAGQSISVWIGDRSAAHRLFAGRIISVTALYEGEKNTLVAYDIRCVDPTWLLDRQKVLAQYTNQSATAIAQQIIASFTRQVTTVNIQAGLANVPEITFTNEEVSSALSRLAEKIGAYWYVDYDNDLHFFTTEGGTATPITQANPHGSRAHQYEEDLSQTVTVVIARGGGGKTVSDVAIGTTTLPVDDGTWYAATGGYAEVGPQRIYYASVEGITELGATTGQIASPPAPFLDTNAGGSPALPLGTYRVAFTWAKDYTETPAGPVANLETMAGPETLDTLSGGHNQIMIRLSNTLDAPPDPGIKSIGIYISDTNGSSATLKLWTRYPYPYPAGLGGWLSITTLSGRTKAPPTVSTAGESSVPIAPGAATITVDNLAAFLPSGWAIVPGNQYIRYTGRSASSGSGQLTGIPPSGPGSVTAPVRSGTIKQVPQLTGIPASGADSIRIAVKAGITVTLRYEVSDFAAADDLANRFAIAPIVRDDGWVYEVWSDSRFTLPELTATAAAILSDRKTPARIVNFESRDGSLVIGRTVTLALTTPVINGTFRIQRVVFSEIAIGGAQRHWTPPPLRSVQATNKLFSFADVLRRISDASGIGLGA